MSVLGRLSDGLIRWTGKYDNKSLRIKTPYVPVYIYGISRIQVTCWLR